MMDTIAQEKLRTIFAQDGLGLLDDPYRLQEKFDLLFSEHPEERRILLAAWRERIPHELFDLRGRPLSDLVRRELSLRLARRQELSEDSALWSVAAWAFALGVQFADAVSPPNAGFAPGPSCDAPPPLNIISASTPGLALAPASASASISALAPASASASASASISAPASASISALAPASASISASATAPANASATPPHHANSNANVNANANTSASKLDPSEIANLELAARAGNVDAQLRLGFLHENGQGVPKDSREAVRWFSRAAKGGSPDAQCQLGIHLLEGAGVPRDYAKAREWFESAARRNNSEAQYQLFQMALDGKCPLSESEPRQWLEKAAANGHAQAQCMLGIWYFDNPTGTKDGRRAFNLLQKASKQRIPLAHLYLGRILESGDGAARDVSLALEHYRIALKSGEAEAGPAIDLLLSGLRTSEIVAFGLQARDDGNHDRAVFWWQRAADRGDVSAQKYLADLLLIGLGGRHDPALALALYRKSAEGGNAEAQFALAELHERGEEVSRDFSIAYTYYFQAAKKGHPLANLRMDLLSEKMLPDDLFERAREAESAGDDAQAFFWYSHGARRKDPRCCQQLGLFLKAGRGSPRDAEKARDWLLKAAELGQPEAWHQLGLMAGESRFLDPTQAFACFSKGAESGNLECWFKLGQMHERGEGRAVDGFAALSCYKIAAERGDAKSQNSLGFMLLEGKLVPQDLPEAERMFRKAAAQGLPRAHINLGNMYYRGIGLPQDFDQAARCYSCAAELGDLDAQLQLGFLFSNRDWVGASDREAERWFMKAAGKGLVEALSALGELNLGRENFADALEFFQHAANKNHAPSQYRLGWMFLEGRGVAPNLENARIWLQKAAKNGHPKAQARLGELHVDGRGVPMNLQEAARLFRSSAKSGDPEGLLRLAEMLLEGKGVPKDAHEAARLLQESADQGHPPAQLLLGILFEEGTTVEQNLILAYKWYNLAAVSLPEATNRRNALSKPGWMGFGRPRLLPPDELEAQRLSREWKPKPAAVPR